MPDIPISSKESSPPAAIAKAIIAVMKATKSIEMTGFNKHQQYKYASIEDVLRAVQPAMADAGLVLFMSAKHWTGDDAKNFVVEYSATLAHESGAVWENCASWLGVARAMDDKWANKCHTAAEKTFLCSLFHIPRGIEDDADAHDGQAEVKSPPPRRAPTQAAKITPPPKTNGAKLADWWAKGKYEIERVDRDGVVMSWSDWATKISRAIESAPDPVKLKAFWQANSSTLKAMEDEDPSVHEFLISARNTQLNHMEGVAA